MKLVSLITGASTGIGRAAALALARRGHPVVATMRDLARGDELRAITAREKLPVSFAPLDVTDDASVASAIADALAAHGRLDALVANAGFHAGAALEETPLATFRALYETNVLGSDEAWIALHGEPNAEIFLERWRALIRDPE